MAARAYMNSENLFFECFIHFAFMTISAIDSMLCDAELLTSDTLKVDRLESLITYVRYAQSRQVGKSNNLRQIRSKSTGWKV